MNETEKRAAADVIRFWGCWGAAADEKIAGLLSGLEEQDAEAAEKWRGIVDYWRYVQTGMRVHFGQVPEALPEDDSLCFAVLGYGLNPDGTIMDELAGRLRAALRCARQYPNALILCTGGKRPVFHSASLGAVSARALRGHGQQQLPCGLGRPAV